MNVGYARVSTGEQTPDLQRRALTAAGCEQVFEDQISGTVTRRPGLDRALACLGAGDVLVVWRLDRLGRSLPHQERRSWRYGGASVIRIKRG